MSANYFILEPEYVPTPGVDTLLQCNVKHLHRFFLVSGEQSVS